MANCLRLGFLAGLYATLHLVAGASAGENLQQVLSSDPPQLDATRPSSSGQKGLRGRFLHITDFHPDEFYKSYTNIDEACHRRKGNAGPYGAELTSCDSPRSLANATLEWVAANLKDDIDFVVWTGDSARHDGDELLPRTAAEVLRSNKYLADLMFSTFADDQNPNRLAIPVIPNIGNNDFLPHNILLPGPNKWLQHYTEVWRSFIPEEQRHSFEFGGWFSVEVIPNRLAVFSLNTMYFFDRNAAIDDCVNPVEPGYKQLEWLRIQLAILRSRGMKAILMGHVPPAKTDSKELWDGTCWQKYSLWLRQYRDVITGSIYGHMNIDHFVIHDTKEIDIDFIGGAADEVSDESIDLGFGDEDDEDDDENENEEDGEDQDLEDLVELKRRNSVSPTSSKGKYLSELRDMWAKLPPVKVLCHGEQGAETSDAEDQGKRRKGKKRKSKKQRKKQHLKKLGGRWAERYHVSLISSSVVPNYFPSLRVFEYNITGLEDVPRWSPPNEGLPSTRQYAEDDSDLADLHQEIELAKAIRAASPGKGGNKKKNKKKKGKGNKPKDPSLVIPDPPSKTAVPGPAYSMQPLTLTGYTQYFSNLTDINNLPPSSDPKRKKKPEAKEFNFEVQYSTFTDKVLKLTDLTVRNYVRLAFRMGLAAADEQKSKNLNSSNQDGTDEDEFDDGDDEGTDSPDEDEDVDEESELVECESFDGTALKKKDKKRRKKESDRAWRRFVKYAFVSTGVEEAYNLVGVRRDGDDE